MTNNATLIQNRFYFLSEPRAFSALKSALRSTISDLPNNSWVSKDCKPAVAQPVRTIIQTSQVFLKKFIIMFFYDQA